MGQIVRLTRKLGAAGTTTLCEVEITGQRRMNERKFYSVTYNFHGLYTRLFPMSVPIPVISMP